MPNVIFIPCIFYSDFSSLPSSTEAHRLFKFSLWPDRLCADTARVLYVRSLVKVGKFSSNKTHLSQRKSADL